MARRQTRHAVLLTTLATVAALGSPLASPAAGRATEPGPDRAACDPFRSPVTDPDVPTARDVIGIDLGDRDVTAAESDRYLRAVADASPRVVDGVLARSWNGRPLRYAVIGKAKWVRPDALRSIGRRLDRLRDADTSEARAERITARTPAVLWVAGNVHGNEESGADAALIVLPYYNRPNQDGLYAHFLALTQASSLPIVVYNVPGRTGSNVEAATTLRLAEVPNIVAVKEASGNLVQVQEILRDRPDGFAVLSGDDQLTLGMVAAGGDGVISVVSNATPRLMAELCDRAAAGDLAGARALHQRLVPWMTAAFVESNPIPVKAALDLLGHRVGGLRLPMVEADEEQRAVVRRALEGLSLL